MGRRAKDKLHISFARQDSEGEFHDPSRFLGEIPEELQRAWSRDDAQSTRPTPAKSLVAAGRGGGHSQGASSDGMAREGQREEGWRGEWTSAGSGKAGEGFAPPPQRHEQQVSRGGGAASSRWVDQGASRLGRTQMEEEMEGAVWPRSVQPGSRLR